MTRLVKARACGVLGGLYSQVVAGLNSGSAAPVGKGGTVLND